MIQIWCLKKTVSGASERIWRGLDRRDLLRRKSHPEICTYFSKLEDFANCLLFRFDDYYFCIYLFWWPDEDRYENEKDLTFQFCYSSYLWYLVFLCFSLIFRIFFVLLQISGKRISPYYKAFFHSENFTFFQAQVLEIPNKGNSCRRHLLTLWNFWKTIFL